MEDAPSHEDAGDVDDLVSALVGAELISIVENHFCIHTSMQYDLG